MKEKVKKISTKVSEKYGRLKYAIGLFLIAFGIFALITPFTPGAFLAIVVGLEIFGVHLLERNWNFFKRKKRELTKTE